MTIGAGSESGVNSTTAGDQTLPQAIALADGTHIVVWGTSTGWSLQRFDEGGSRLGGEVAYAGQVPSAWIALPDGRAAFAYLLPYTPFYQLYFGILNGDGSMSLPDMMISTGLDPFTLNRVTLAVNESGVILVGASDRYAAAGILLEPDGDGIDSAFFGFQGNEDGYGIASNVRLAVAPTGDFLAIYDREQDGAYMRYFLPDGTLGPELAFQLPLGANVLHGDGVLTFAWTDTDADGDLNVAIGTTDGSSFDAWWAGAKGTSPSDLKLWQLADGRALVTWTAASGDGDGTSVMGQLAARGVPLGEAFVINATAAGDQSAVSIATLSDGRFVATWQTPGIDGDGMGIASRTFDPKDYVGIDTGDFWIGGEFSDHIVGGAGADILAGEGGDDSVYGGGGADWIYGGAGDDTIDGGDGADLYIAGWNWGDLEFKKDGARLLVSLRDDPSYGTKSLTNIETIRFSIGAERAVSAVFANSGPVAVADRNGSDKVREGRDSTAQGNVLANDKDADFVIGDRLEVTSVRFSKGTSHAVEPNGVSLAGKYGTLTLEADGSYHYALRTRDIGSGDPRADTTLSDTFSYTAADSRGAISSAKLTIDLSLLPIVRGTSHSDLIDKSHKVNGRAASGSGEHIFGRDGSDTIKASSGNDRVRGDAGNDKLDGGNGNDTLIGGSGSDTLTGGNDRDTFVFNARLGKSNVDTITIFGHDIDRILLDDKIFAAIGPSLGKSEFYARYGATKAHDSNDHIIYDRSTGRLYYDADGKGGHAAVHFATFGFRGPLDYDDFAIV